MTATMEHPSQPRAAACPDLKELRTATAQQVYLASGFEAVAGWPLPNGWLPVAVAGLGMVMMTPAEWEAYRALCEGELLMLTVNG